MNAILAPAARLMAQLSLRGALVLLGFLFMLPLLIVFYVAWAASGAPALELVAGQGAASLLVLLSLGGAVYLACGFYSMTTTGRLRMKSMLERIASGDLTGNINRQSAGPLWESLAQANTSLTQVVNQVRVSADAIVTGSKEIAAGNTNLSQRTEEQAATLEETASSMEQLAGTVKQNESNCKRASTAAAGATTVAGKAADGIGEVTRTMQEIDTSARRVTDIIGVIEGIAFQTNILALNAAVEAARAGEQGRGFAVVAAEVRSLAHRSADAAKEIKGLIESSTDSAARGTKLVEQAGATMNEVVASVREVNQLIKEIATASSEQSAAVEDINRAVLQMDNVTQQNAALVEQAMAAALAFEDEAGRMVDVVGTFKLDRMEDRDHAVALVKRAILHLRERGVERACDDFENPNGGFVSGEYYVYAFDVNGRGLAHPHIPTYRGSDAFAFADADGRKISLEALDIVQSRGRGWSDYRLQNPATGQIEAKSAYVEMANGVVIGCGIYNRDKNRADAGTAHAAPRPALRQGKGRALARLPR